MSTTSTGRSTRPGRTQAGPQNRIGTWVSYSCGEPWVVIDELDAEHPVGLEHVLHVARHVRVPGPAHRRRRSGAPARLPRLQFAPGVGAAMARLGQQQVARRFGDGVGIELAFCAISLRFNSSDGAEIPQHQLGLAEALAPARAFTPRQQSRCAMMRPAVAALRLADIGRRHEAVVGGQHRDVVVACRPCASRSRKKACSMRSSCSRWSCDRRDSALQAWLT